LFIFRQKMQHPVVENNFFIKPKPVNSIVKMVRQCLLVLPAKDNYFPLQSVLPARLYFYEVVNASINPITSAPSVAVHGFGPVPKK
jgi:hypothetical protein